MAELTDKFLVNRNGSTYQTELEQMANLEDTDLVLVNRDATTYTVTGEDLKESLKPVDIPPVIDEVVLTEVYDGENRYTDKEFPYNTIMTLDGEPAPTYSLKAKFSGTTFDFDTLSDPISQVEGGGEQVYQTENISQAIDYTPPTTKPADISFLLFNAGVTSITGFGVDNRGDGYSHEIVGLRINGTPFNTTNVVITAGTGYVGQTAVTYLWESFLSAFDSNTRVQGTNMGASDYTCTCTPVAVTTDQVWTIEVNNGGRTNGTVWILDQDGNKVTVWGYPETTKIDLQFPSDQDFDKFDVGDVVQYEYPDLNRSRIWSSGMTTTTSFAQLPANAFDMDTTNFCGNNPQESGQSRINIPFDPPLNFKNRIEICGGSGSGDAAYVVVNSIPRASVNLPVNNNGTENYTTLYSGSGTLSEIVLYDTVQSTSGNQCGFSSIKIDGKRLVNSNAETWQDVAITDKDPASNIITVNGGNWDDSNRSYVWSQAGNDAVLSGTKWADAFDGQLKTNGWDGAAIGENSTATIVLPASVSGAVRIYASTTTSGSPVGQGVKLYDGSNNLLADIAVNNVASSPQWIDAGDLTEVRSIQLYSGSADGSSVGLQAIEVDGKLLVDDAIDSEEWSNSTITAGQIYSAVSGYSLKGMFNGATQTTITANGDTTYTETGVTFTLPAPLSCTSGRFWGSVGYNGTPTTETLDFLDENGVLLSSAPVSFGQGSANWNNIASFSNATQIRLSAYLGVMALELNGKQVLDKSVRNLGDRELTKVVPYDNKLTLSGDENFSILTGDVIGTTGSQNPTTKTPYKLTTSDIDSVKVISTYSEGVTTTGTIWQGTPESVFSNTGNTFGTRPDGSIIVRFDPPITNFKVSIGSGDSDSVGCSYRFSPTAPWSEETTNANDVKQYPETPSEVSYFEISNQTRGNGAFLRSCWSGDTKLLDVDFVPQYVLTFEGDASTNPDLQYFKAGDLVTEGEVTGFDNDLWKGNGTSQDITDLGFSPDLVWVKARDVAGSNIVTDTLRGPGKTLKLNDTDAETEFSVVTAFLEDGYTVGNNSSANAAGNNYMGYAWDAGDEIVNGTVGDLNYRRKSNPDTGFCILEFTDQAGTYAIPHGLNSEVKFLISKAYKVVNSFYVYHDDLPSRGYCVLNSSGSAQTDYVWEEQTNSEIVINNSFTSAGYQYIMYAFAEVPGVSKFGELIPDGTAGTIDCGFKPGWLMIKRYDGAGNWIVASRQTNDQFTYANQSDSEETGLGLTWTDTGIDYMSGSFTAGAKFIYAVFSERDLIAKVLKDPSLDPPQLVMDGGNWDNTNQSQVWSNNVVGGSVQDVGYPIQNAFKGDLTSDNYTNACFANPGNFMQLSFTEFIDAQTVDIYFVASGSGLYLEVNGVQVTPFPNSGSTPVKATVDVNGTGLQSVKWNTLNGTNFVGLVGISVDGRLLVDKAPGDAVFSDTTGWSADSGYEDPKNLFDGDVGTVVTPPGNKRTLTAGEFTGQIITIRQNGVTDNFAGWELTINGSEVFNPTAQINNQYYEYNLGSVRTINKLEYAWVSQGGDGAAYTLNGIFVDGALLIDSNLRDFGASKVQVQTSGGQGTVIQADETDNTLLISNTGDETTRWIGPNSGEGSGTSFDFKVATEDAVPITQDFAYGTLAIVDNKALVTGIIKDEPEYLPVPSKDYSIKLPQEFPTGNTPDVDLPRGTCIAAIVKAENTIGSSEKESNCLMPADVNPDGAAGPIVAQTPTTITCGLEGNLNSFTTNDSLVMVDENSEIASYSPETTTIAKVTSGLPLVVTQDEVYNSSYSWDNCFSAPEQNVGATTSTGRATYVYNQTSILTFNEPFTGDLRFLISTGSSGTSGGVITIKNVNDVSLDSITSVNPTTSGAGYKTVTVASAKTIEIAGNDPGFLIYGIALDGVPVLGNTADQKLTFTGDSTTNPDLKFFKPNDVLSEGSVVLDPDATGGIFNVTNPENAVDGSVITFAKTTGGENYLPVEWSDDLTEVTIVVENKGGSAANFYFQPFTPDKTSYENAGNFTEYPSNWSIFNNNGWNNQLSIPASSEKATLKYSIQGVPEAFIAQTGGRLYIQGADVYVYSITTDGSSIGSATVVSVDVANNSMIVSGGKWDASNRSQAWSNLVQGNVDPTYLQPYAAFDGVGGTDFTDGCRPVQGETLFMDFGTTFQSASTMKVSTYCALSTADRANNLKINGVKVDHTLFVGTGYMEVEIPLTNGLSTLEWGYAVPGAESGYVYLIELSVDGRTLVDDVYDSKVWSESPYNSDTNVQSATYPSSNAFDGVVTNSYTDSWLPAQGNTQLWNAQGEFDDAESVMFYYIAEGSGQLTVNDVVISTVSSGSIQTVTVDVTGVGLQRFTNNWAASSNSLGILGVRVDGKMLIDAGVRNLGPTYAKTGPVSGTGTFQSVNIPAKTITLSSSNDRFIDSSNRLGETFYVRDNITVLNVDNPKHVALQQAISDAFDAFQTNVEARKVSIASNFEALSNGDPLDASDLAELQAIVDEFTS